MKVLHSIYTTAILLGVKWLLMVVWTCISLLLIAPCWVFLGRCVSSLRNAYQSMCLFSWGRYDTFIPFQSSEFALPQEQPSPQVRHRWNNRLLASHWLGTGSCGHLLSEAVDGRPVSFYLTNKMQINEWILSWFFRFPWYLGPWTQLNWTTGSLVLQLHLADEVS